jgi:hypothetical protein
VSLPNQTYIEREPLLDKRIHMKKKKGHFTRFRCESLNDMKNLNCPTSKQQDLDMKFCALTIIDL